MQKELNNNICFPQVYMKTPLIEESISLKNGVYLADTRIEIVIYQKSNKKYCSVITKDINFKNGRSQTILLKYFNDIDDYDDVLDLTDEYMEKHSR